VLQVRLPAEFLVKYHTQYTRMRAWVDGRGRQDEGAGAVMLCPCFGELHKDILHWGKRCPVPPCPLQATLVDSLQQSAVLLC
jgi:hypothetical protein